MSRVKVSMRSGSRDLERFPAGDDDALGRSLFSLLAGSLVRGLPRPVVLGVLPERVQQLDGRAFRGQDAKQRGMLVAALAGQDEVECVALVGTLNVRMQGMKAPGKALAVFVEWPDNRWWGAWQFVGAERELLGDGPVVRKAVDGWPRPGGIGGWFARARRTGARLTFEGPSEPAGPVVH